MAANRFRALVVDDEAPIRKLAAAALRKLDFECDDAADGEVATELAAKSRYDVVIVDLKMPNKNGHALSLDFLKLKDRPLIIVHTGVTDPRLATDLLTRGVDDVVYKPTDFGLLAAKIKVMVERRPRPSSENKGASRPAVHAETLAEVEEPAVGDSVNLSQLNAKLSRISSVLPVSHTAIDVYEMTRSDNWKVSQIAAAVQRDASLVAQVLRLANSSLYNPSGRRIINLDEAVVRIGQNRVGELALAANALSTVTPSMLPWMDLELAWKRSMAAGIALESLIEAGGHQGIEEGLLLSAIMHPLGRVVLAMLFSKHYQAIVEQCNQTSESLREQERRTFPTNHPEIMAHLLATWRIPPDVCLPLKYSMDDFSVLARLSEPARTRAELVKVSIVLGRLAVGRWENWDFVAFPNDRVLNRLRIHDVGHIIDQTRTDVNRLAEFRPGAGHMTETIERPSAEQQVLYCNAAGGVDLLRAILPSMGLRPQNCTVDEIRQMGQPAIISYLGAADVPISIGDVGKCTIVVTEQEHRDKCDRIACTAALPDSYARFREAVFSALPGVSADQQLVGTSP